MTHKANIFFDIETIPTQNENIKQFVKDKLIAPANYKKQESIDAWKEENKDVAYRKTALNGGFGQVVCISFAVNDGEIKTVYSDDWVTGEAEVLKDFFNGLVDAYTPQSDIIPTFIGHNIDSFDLRFIYQRAIVLGIKPPSFLPLNSKSYNNHYIFDTMTEWAGKRNFVSLNEVCMALGIPPKADDIDGYKVWDYVQAGEIKRVAEYCADDVSKVRDIYNRMTFNQ